MSFTNFCCRSGGSNLNSGTRTGDDTEPGVAADFEYASGTWVAATGIFTPVSGDPSADGVAVGDFVSVYADGSTVTNFVAPVTAVDSTTITVNTAARLGSIPTDGVLNRTLRVGGAWQGPNGSSAFPYANVTETLIKPSPANTIPRVNYKNDQTYSITAGLGSTGKRTAHQGYTDTYGDGGRAVIEGPTTGTTFNLTSISQTSRLEDLEFRQNGDTGTSAGVNITIDWVFLRRVVVHDVAGLGITSNADTVVLECEAYNCGLHSATGSAGMKASGGEFVRCIAHHNTGATGLGFTNGKSTVFIDCIAHHNGQYGFNIAAGGLRMYNCDSFANGDDGAHLPGSAVINVISNCNFADNAGYGIGADSGQKGGIVENCSFGSGSRANDLGEIETDLVNNQGVNVVDNETLPADVTPWTGPDEGDFRINLGQVQKSGRSKFLQTMAGFSGTTGSRDRGAAGGFSRRRETNPDITFHPKPILRPMKPAPLEEEM